MEIRKILQVGGGYVKKFKLAQTKEDKMTRKIRSLRNVGRTEIFGIWWKISKFIIKLN